MLPSDVLGISVYSALDQEFEFKRGPVFTTFCWPTKSIAPLRKRSQPYRSHERRPGHVDAHSYQLPQPFLVIATQNPVEHHGTYPLPSHSSTAF